MTKHVSIAAIRIDGGTQPRAELNQTAVSEYAEAMTAGATMPPVTLFFDGSSYWLADGFHRYHATRKIGAMKIAADVREGTQRDAILHSAGSNGTHGLRRTNEDKRRAVQSLLDDDEWSQWSDRKIAEHCGVSAPFVSAIRRPEAAVRQQAQRDKSAAKKSEGCNPITPLTDSPANAGQPFVEKAKAPPAPPAPEPAAAEVDELKSMLAEQAGQFESTLAENIALHKVVDADDKLAEAVAQVKQLTAENQKLRERITGLTNECAEAKKLAKYWRAQAQKQAA